MLHDSRQELAGVEVDVGVENLGHKAHLHTHQPPHGTFDREVVVQTDPHTVVLGLSQF